MKLFAISVIIETIENVVLGIGSYTYQYVTRDTYGWAIKATYGERNGQPYKIYKQPKTDSGLKNSAKGLLTIENFGGKLSLVEDVNWDMATSGEAKLVFRNGMIHNEQSLSQIRNTLKSQL